MPVDKRAAQAFKVFIHKRRKRRRLGQLRHLSGAHRTMPAALRCVVVAKILRQAMAQARVTGKQRQHGVNPHDFGIFMGAEVAMQPQA